MRDFLSFLKRFYLFIFGERVGEGREGRGEWRETLIVAFHTPPTQEVAPQPKHML